jgi:hypothetical protein
LVEVVAEAVSFGSPQWKKMAIKIKKYKNKRDSIIIFEKILHIVENKIIIKTAPFLYE